MQFMRRPDIDTVARVHIAAQAFLGLGVYGVITQIATSYRVSRLFVYKLLWQLMLLYELDVCAPGSPEASRKEVDRHILLLRLEGHCALERIAQILKQLGLPFSSVGYISQRLAAYAQALPQEAWTDAPIVFLLCDEIFTLGQPILLTVEPRSLAILKIELVENREAETWKQHWEALAEAGLLEQQTVVSDQGPGLVKGCALMGLTPHPDLFHLLRPLAMFGERFYRKALAAIAREYERGGVGVGRSEEVINKRSGADEAAQAEAEEQVRRYDNFCYLWTALRQALELFDEQGAITALAFRKGEIDAIVTLMDELDGAQLHQDLASFASGLEGYWGYYQRAEQVFQECITRYPREVVQALACGWQLARQATNSKVYGMRKRLAQDAEFYFAYAATLLPEASEALRKEMVEALDAEVRSSSLIENVNSTLRPLLETCRGQVDQPLLDLFAYVHNHRRFVRGKRAGKAPIDILTGNAMDKTWLTSLLETI
jgi:tetratricopeptide (TPR) repeat protein